MMNATSTRSGGTRTFGRRPAVIAVAAAAMLMLACAAAERARADDTGSPTEAAGVAQPAILCPPIPGAKELELTGQEWDDIESGDIVVRIVEQDDQVQRAQAVGYLDAHPLWLFDLATDSELAPEIVDEVKRVEVIEVRPDGKLATGYIKAALLLPTFKYTFESVYLPSRTGQCWGQVEGDFSRNEGAHSFLWDPARKKTLGVFSFTIGLRGLLSLIPERLVLQGAADTLHQFMRSLEQLAPQIAEKDPARARRIESAWSVTRPRLENGEYPGRLWTGYEPLGEEELASATSNVADPGRPVVEAR